MEAGCDRVLLAHVGAALGRSEILAAAVVIDPGTQVDPDDGITAAARFGLGFGRVLPLPDCTDRSCRQRNAAAFRNKNSLRLSARRNLVLVGAPLVPALLDGLL